MKNRPNQPDLFSNILPIKNSFSIKNASRLQTEIISLLQKGNIPLAEIYTRMVLSKESNNPYALNFLGWISCALGFYEKAIFYFERALEKDNSWGLPCVNNDRRICGRQGKSLYRKWMVKHISNSALFKKMVK